MDNRNGKIIKITGPVLDVQFPVGGEPPINALLSVAGGDVHMEVATHVKPGVVRCIALESTEGFK